MKKETEKLLKECTAGTKMGERALSLAIPYAKNAELKAALEGALKSHAIIGDEAKQALFSARRHDKEPNALVQMMSDAKMKAMLALNGSPATVAGLITDGCDMGTKALAHALNSHPTADPSARRLARQLIAAEDDLREILRRFL